MYQSRPSRNKVISCRDFFKKKKVSGALFWKLLAPNSNLNEQCIPNKPHTKSNHIIYHTHLNSNFWIQARQNQEAAALLLFLLLAAQAKYSNSSEQSCSACPDSRTRPLRRESSERQNNILFPCYDQVFEMCCYCLALQFSKLDHLWLLLWCHSLFIRTFHLVSFMIFES